MTTTAAYTPFVLCSTAGMSNEEWLVWRTHGIGGSDAGTVLGVNPYKTKRELFFEKTGVWSMTFRINLWTRLRSIRTTLKDQR